MSALQNATQYLMKELPIYTRLLQKKDNSKQKQIDEFNFKYESDYQTKLI